ncbi:MAG: class A sortase, partial [Pediococcus parvulus]
MKKKGTRIRKWLTTILILILLLISLALIFNEQIKDWLVD